MVHVELVLKVRNNGDEHWNVAWVGNSNEPIDMRSLFDRIDSIMGRKGITLNILRADGKTVI